MASALRLAGPGLCGTAATLTGVGIGRFAYVAILPLLVQQAWFSRTEAGYLGAANLTGYFLGIGLAAWLSRYWTAGRMVRAVDAAVRAEFFQLRLAGRRAALVPVLAHASPAPAAPS